MRFGVNYTPRRGWFHAWLDLDLGEVREDFQAIAGLGADHVRIFPLWPLLQPNRTLIRPRAVRDVAAVAQVAADCGLDTSVDVLQGHLSSFDFLPSWVQTWHHRNLVTDAAVVDAQAALVRELGAALRDVPRAQGLCAGNEFPQFAATRHPDPAPATSAEADAWLDALLGAARAVWPEGRHVHSFDDGLWFDDSNPFTPEHAVTRGDVTTVHSWIFGSLGQRYGADAPQAAWFARWLCELADGWATFFGRAGRRVWLQEVGAPSSHLSPDAVPGFVEGTVDVLLGGRGGGVAPGLDAITWWCSHDVSRDLADFPELEHTLGLLDTDGEITAAGAAFSRAAARWRHTSAAAEPPHRAYLDVPVAGWEARSSTSAAGPWFADWYADATAGDLRGVRPVLA